MMIIVCTITLQPRGGAKEHLDASARSRVFFRVITKRKNIYIYVIKRGRGYGWQRITTRHEYLRTVRKGTKGDEKEEKKLKLAPTDEKHRMEKF